MEGYIGQIIIFTRNWTPKDWMPCDGRELKFKEFLPLASVLGVDIPEGYKYSDDFPEDLTFNLPTIGSANPDFNYIVCTNGLFPARS